MLLVTKIFKQDITDYRLEFLECLNHNLSLTEIKKIVVFTDLFDNKIPPNPKLTIRYKSQISDFDIIKFSKSDPLGNFIIYQDWKLKLSSDFNKVTEEDLNNYVINFKNLLWIYKKDCQINNSSNIFNMFNRPVKNVNFHFNTVKLKPKNQSTTREVNPNVLVRKAEPSQKIQLKTRDKKLDVIIISVNYNDYLLLTLSHNIKIFENITVVTSTDDLMCQEICKKLGVKYLITDVMYENGDKFNKGKAINFGINSLENPDLILLLDSDIIVTKKIDLSQLDDEALYTSSRWICKTQNKLKEWESDNNYDHFIRDNDKGWGFFQLFNKNFIPGDKLFPETSQNAAMSDLMFRDKFPNRKSIEIDVIHLGDPAVNWNGRRTSRFLSDDEFYKIFSNLEEFITILYPPTINWELLFQRPQQLMKNFSNQNSVRSLFWNSRGENKKIDKIKILKNNLYLIDQFVDIKNFEFLFRGKKIFWFSHPSHYYIADKFNWDLVIFDAIDNPVDEFAEWSNELNNAVKKSDIIFASAKIMYDEHLKSNKPVYMLPNGSDFELFEKSQQKLNKPDDFPDLKGPIIGYYGAMATWLDWEIIEKISTKYNILMIGGNKYYNERINSPNIHYLSHKKIDELPNYLSHIDVPIIPFKLTEMIKGCDPIKFYEYISSGKPTVVTQMIELERFKDICYFMNIDNCLDVIETALNEDDNELKNKRIEVAKLNSWDIRAKYAVEKIRKHLNAK
jgi:hypothetical protein